MKKYVVTHKSLGYWNGKIWVHTIEAAKKYLTQDELMEDMQSSGYASIKALIIIPVEIPMVEA